MTSSVHDFMDRISGRSQAVEGVKFGGLWIPSLLFADYVVLLASSNSDLQPSLGRFAAEREMMGMTFSNSKSDGSQPEKGGLSTPGQRQVNSPGARFEGKIE